MRCATTGSTCPMPTDIPPALGGRSGAGIGARVGAGIGARVRRLGVPVRDPRFWVVQGLVLAIDVGHTLFEDVGLLVGHSVLYLLSISVFLIPVVYAALGFGLRGAVPTALWALVLSVPEISQHDSTTKIGILTQFAIVLAIAVIVAVGVDRERAAARATEEANRQLSRLNATASAVAGSLDVDHVLRGTLRAELDPRKQQVVWLRLTGSAEFSERTYIDAARGEAPAVLDAVQERLTAAACLDGRLHTDDPTSAGARTVVAALRSEDRVLGAIGLTQLSGTVSADDYQVHSAVANQLSVALNNIATHRQNRAALASLEAAKRNLETYIALATEAQEEERKRLSRELHDDILQSLVVAKSKIESANGAGGPALAHSRLLDAQAVLGDAIVDVRRYCHDLRPSLLDDLGLVQAVDWLVGDLRARTGLDVDLEAAGVAHRLSSKDELLIFRIVQEALHNVERHAQATRARVCLSYAGDALEVSVSDDGCGMSGGREGRAGDRPDPGLGLRGMDERTKLLRGRLTIRSEEGRGTELSLEVPLSVYAQTRPGPGG